MRKTILIGLALAGAPAAAGAQNSLPGLENFTLDRPQPPRPTATPTPTPPPSPTPAATPSPAATAVPTPPPAVVPSAAPSATPPPGATRSPVPRPSPSASVAPPVAGPAAPPSAAMPAPATPAPVATASPAASAAPPAAGGSNWPLWLGIAAAAVAALGAGSWWWRRRQALAAAELWAAPGEPPADLAVAPPAPPAPVVPPAASSAVPSPPVPAAPPVPVKRPGGLITTALRPELAFDLRPLTAGIDALRATVDFELSVVNVGRADAHAVTIESWLIGAGSDPRAELAPLFAQPPGAPLLPPFTLPASGHADLNAQTVVARELLPTITAGKRKLFVPLVAVRASWRDGRGQPAGATVAFLVGAAPPGQERLAPLALDRGTRTYRTLAARHLDG